MTRAMRRGVFLVCAFSVTLWFAASALVTSGQTPSACAPKPESGITRAKGKRPVKTVVLTPADDSKKLTWRFDADRGEKSWDVVIIAKPPLTGIKSSEIEVRSRQLVREDQHASFPRPTITPPQVSRDGERITFTVCANPEGIQAGAYSGSLLVDGPEEVTGTTIDIAVTARSSGWFSIGLGIAALAVLGGLTLKSVADFQRDRKGTSQEWDLKKAVLYIWRAEDGRVLTTIGGIVAAGVSVLLIYNKDTTWGDDYFVDLLAVAQAAIAAVGAQGILDGLRGSVSEK